MPVARWIKKPNHIEHMAQRTFRGRAHPISGPKGFQSRHSGLKLFGIGDFPATCEIAILIGRFDKETARAIIEAWQRKHALLRERADLDVHLVVFGTGAMAAELEAGDAASIAAGAAVPNARSAVPFARSTSQSGRTPIRSCTPETLHERTIRSPGIPSASARCASASMRPPDQRLTLAVGEKVVLPRALGVEPDAYELALAPTLSCG